MRSHVYFLLTVITALLTICCITSCSRSDECKHAAEVVRENIVEATCTEEGTYDAVVKCTKCSFIIKRVTKTEGKRDHTPSGEVKEKLISPTCTTVGSYDRVVFCLVCGFETTRQTVSVAPLGHKASAIYKENYVAPNCSTVGGYDECTYCERCGDKLSTNHTVMDKSDEHIITIDAGYSATKTEDGLTNGAHCSLCGVIITEQQIIPADLTGTDIELLGFTLQDGIFKNTVDNAADTINFTTVIYTNSKSTVTISLDESGDAAIPSLIAKLSPGENTFYIKVTDKDNISKTYPVKIYRRCIYTVSFKTDGGTPIPDIEVEEGEYINPPEATREYYIFVGWDHDFSFPITEDVTANAIWRPIYSTYLVEVYFETVEKDGYELYSSESFNHECGKNVEVKPEEYRHFTFDPSASTLRGTVNEDGSLVLKLYYTRDTYKITNSESYGIVFGLGEYPYGAKVTLIAKSNRGYVFHGWYDGEIYVSNKTTYTFTADRDITACWELEEYTVEYYDSGRMMELKPDKYTIKDGDITLPSPTKEHYLFYGWYTSYNFTGHPIDKIEANSTGDLTLYARFIEIKYKISYNTGGGTNSKLNPDSYSILSILPIRLFDPIKDGYTFLGWYKDVNLSEPIDKIDRMLGDVTLYAMWRKDHDEPEVPQDPEYSEYSITYMHGDKALNHYPSSYREGYKQSLTDYSLPHYTFIGWYTDPSHSEESRIGQINEHMSGDIVLYAKFEPVTYTIIYETYGGELSEDFPTEYSITDTFPIVLPLPSKEGYIFSGWYTDENLTCPIDKLDSPIGNLKLYAGYGKPADPNIPELGTVYTITYRYGEKKLSLEPESYEYGSITELPEYALEGYTFEGWYTTADFKEGTKIVIITENVSGNLKLYAKMIPKE